MAEKQFRTKADEAYHRLREMIERGDFDTGKRLTELGAVEMLGIGRTSVREAIHRLEARGLLKGRHSRRGRQIHYLEDADPHEVLLRYEAREAIQSQAARLAARNMDRAQKEELLALARQMPSTWCVAEEEPPSDAKARFLDSLVANCGNALLYRMWRTHRLDPDLPRSRQFEEEIYARVNGDRTQYGALVLAEAVAGGDEDEAERISRQGVRQIINALRLTLLDDRSPEAS